jgi:DNA mismatch repair protein MutH
MPETPSSVDELLARAAALDGLTLGDVAGRLHLDLDVDPVRTKGQVGQLVEMALGACAGSLDVPDFPDLGVELKTVPLDRRGRVRESTFVCTIDLTRLGFEEWDDSRLWRKLAHVLWVPVEVHPDLPTHQRRLGTPLLWRPSAAEERMLREDWSMLVGRIGSEGIESITAHLGRVLQIRPKAANASVRAPATGPGGEPIQVMPRGFYLRARFTEQVLWHLTD